MEEILVKTRRQLLIVTALLIIVGNAMDVVFFAHQPWVVYTNYFTILITLILVSYWLLTKKHQSLITTVILYVLFVNILSGPFSRMHEPIFGAYFYRMTIIVGIIIPFSGFLIRSYHILIMGSVYCAVHTYVFLVTDHYIIDSSYYLISLLIIAYFGAIYYLFYLLGASHKKQQAANKALQQKNEQLRLQSEQLRHANQTKDKLISIIAHDLRTPFNGILGFGNLIKKEAQALQHQKIINYSGVLLGSSQRAYNLLTNLLDWVRLQSHQVEVNRVTFDLEKKTNDVFDLLQYSIKEKGLSLTKNLNGIATLQADPNVTTTIIRNLITNAIKFTDKGGTIHLEVEQGHSHWQFALSDTGTGMTEQVRQGLFSQSIHPSSQGTNNESGTGLGLSICHKMVQMHGGRIWATSKPGHGSTFYFTIPYH